MTCLNHFRQLPSQTVAVNTLPLLPAATQPRIIARQKLNFEAFLKELEGYKNYNKYNPKVRELIISEALPFLQEDPTRFQTWLLKEDDHVLDCLSYNYGSVQELAYLIPRLLPVLQNCLKNYPQLTVGKRKFLLKVAFYALPKDELSLLLQNRLAKEKSPTVLETLVELLPTRQLATDQDYACLLSNLAAARYSFKNSKTMSEYCQLLRDKKVIFSLNQLIKYAETTPNIRFEDKYLYIRESLQKIPWEELQTTSKLNIDDWGMMLRLFQIEKGLTTVEENFDFLMQDLPAYSIKNERLTEKIKLFLQEQGSQKCSTTETRTYYEKICQAYLENTSNQLSNVSLLAKVVDFKNVPADLREKIKANCALRPTSCDVRRDHKSDNACRAFILGNLAEAEGDTATAKENYRYYGFSLLFRYRGSAGAYGEAISPLCKKTIIKEKNKLITVLSQPQDRLNDLLVNKTIRLEKPLAIGNFKLDELQLDDYVTVLQNLSGLDQKEYVQTFVTYQTIFDQLKHNLRLSEKIFEEANQEQKQLLLQVSFQEGRRLFNELARPFDNQTFRDWCYWVAKINEKEKLIYLPETEKMNRDFLKNVLQKFRYPAMAEESSGRVVVGYLTSGLAAGGCEKESWQLIRKLSEHPAFTAVNYRLPISHLSFRAMLMRMLPRIRDHRQKQKDNDRTTI